MTVLFIIIMWEFFSPSLEDSYKPNTVYSTQYREQTYPTLHSQNNYNSDYDNKMGSQGQLDHREGRLEGSRDSGFSSTNNMYNVSSLRTSRYESNQDLVSPSDSQSDVFDKLSLHGKHGHRDNVYKQSQNSYGSLERNINRRPNRGSERKLSDSDSLSDASSLSVSNIAKRTSKSEYDLSSKGKDSVRDYTNSCNELDLPRFASRPSAGTSQNVYQGSRSDTRFNSRHDSSDSHRLIEVPVKHETARSVSYRTDRKGWQDSASTEPSPIIQSPTKKNFPENPYSPGGSGDSGQGQCYSPRIYEGSRAQPPPKPPHTEHHNVTVRYIGPSGVTQAIPSKIVTVQKMSPHLEVSKPFEMRDFYKYSEKLRRQRLVEQCHQALVGSRASTPSQHSDGDSHSTSYHLNSHGGQGSHHGPVTPMSHPAYRGAGSSASPASSRHMVSNSSYPSSHSSSHEDSSYYGNQGTNSQYGVSTTTSRVQYTVQTQGGRVLYKAQHQSSKQTHYQPPTSMKCEPVRVCKEIRSTSHEAPASSTSR